MARSRGDLRVLGPRGVWVQLKSSAALKQAMENEGIGIRELAALCELKDHGMIWQLRNGRKDSCSPELATKIALHLNVTREHLFTTQTSRDTPRVVRRRTRSVRSRTDVA